MLVGFKDAAFEMSSPFRHATELSHVLGGGDERCKPVLFMYSDGGPDHRLTYVSVQVSLIAIFKKLDLDFLCAGRATLHEAAKRRPVFKAEALDSIAHVKSLLVMLMERLELKGKKFSSLPSASDQDRHRLHVGSSASN